MPQSLAKILVHIVFSTKNRQPLIDPAIEPQLHSYMATVFRSLESPVLLIGGTNDHVHSLCSLSRNYAMKELLQEVKRSTSKWAKTKGAAYRNFYWQDGYGAFSIGESGVAKLKRYILGQKTHHHTVSFQDEMRKFFKLYKMDYDERYVWD
jgi:REP element-mobilizing transposase RayT